MGAGHHHGHNHDHEHGHSHAPEVSARNSRAVAFAAALTGLFMLAEVAGGIISGSLALLADAGHMVTDFASLLLAWVGFRLAARPGDARRSYGFDRFTILAAFANGVLLFIVSAWIVYEAINRFIDPHPVQSGTMLIVAVAGLFVNIAAFWLLSRGDRDNLNIRGAIVHVLGDLLGSVAAIGAALVIRYTGWIPIDPLLSLLVVVLILRSAWSVLSDSAHILLESVPDDIQTSEMGKGLIEAVPGLADVHHLHVWALTEKRRVATLHAELAPGAAAEQVRRAIRDYLHHEHAIGHVTIETEEPHEDCAEEHRAAC